MRSRWIGAVAAAVVLGAALAAVVPVLANGGKSKRVTYRGTLAGTRGAGPAVEFDAELEPLMFRLTTVGGRYRVVRVRIRNTGTAPLALSASADVLEAQVAGGRRLVGILDLGARDAALWDRLPPDLRSAIVYPHGVEPGEEESVFVFFAVAEAADVPDAFRYTIASRPDRPVVIRDVSAAALH